MKDELTELNQIGIVDPINPNFKKALQSIKKETDKPNGGKELNK